jgi:predicted porin
MNTIRPAAVAALACACASAVAQSHVRLYGILDTSLSSIRQPSARVTRLNSGDLQTSRLGIDVVEDLGGGNKAVVGLLAAVGVDAGTAGSAAGFFNLGSSVGLAGSWGSLDAGYLRNPMIFVAFQTDVSGYGIANYASTSILHHQNVTGSGVGGFYANTVRYRTPNWRGLKAEVTHSLGSDTAAPDHNGEFLAGNVQYVQGPLYLGAGLTRTRIRTAASDVSYNGAIVGGAYDFGFVKLGGHWLQTRRPNQKQTGALLNAKVKVGIAGDVDLQLANLREPGGKESRTASVGYTYHLSKRTDLYAYYLRLENNRFGTRGLWYFGQATVSPGAGSSVMGAGVRHAF